MFDHSIESFTEEAREYIRFLRSRRGDEFPVYGRSASGVIVMRLEEGQRIVNVTKTAKEEEEKEEEVVDGEAVEITEAAEIVENTEATEE